MNAQNRTIVWRLRLLTATGLAIVIATLTVIGLILQKVRAERAFVTSEQRRLSEASDELRKFAAQSRNEIHATLDGVEAQPDVGTASINLQRFVQTELGSHPDAAVVKPLRDLNALVGRLAKFADRADHWRGEHEDINSDIRDQRTLKKLRGLIAQFRAKINRAQGEHSIDGCNELSDQLAELARLVEVLAGEEQIEALLALKDGQITPVLDAMAHSIMPMAADPSAGLSPKMIEELRVALFGAHSDTSKIEAGEGGLYSLRRDALRLRRDREKLKTESALLFEEIDNANASFAQSAQGRAVTLAEQLERRLANGWRSMIIFGSACSVVFLWFAFMISRGISGQVKAIDEARAEAEKGRLVTQKLMLEQQAAAVELESVHKKLLETSRQAGMAEVATGVLHNVGNVLNSVNVSSSLVAENLKKSRLGHLGKVAGLLREHEADLGHFITNDRAGKQLPGFIVQLAEFLANEQSACLKEITQLQKNIDHIKEIVSMQQAYAGSAGFMEPVDLRESAEDALRIHLAAMTRHDVTVVKEFSDIPNVLADRHKVLQIMVNLISNAKHAMNQSPSKTLTIRIDHENGRVRALVRDTGYGIAPENLTRIFAHGFTTKSGGHGFGLHSGALAAKELGGSLHAHSDGPGCGATFILELPQLVETSTVAPPANSV